MEKIIPKQTTESATRVFFNGGVGGGGGRRECLNICISVQKVKTSFFICTYKSELLTLFTAPPSQVFTKSAIY